MASRFSKFKSEGKAWRDTAPTCRDPLESPEITNGFRLAQLYLTEATAPEKSDESVAIENPA